MKKWMSLILTLALCMGLCATASAAGTETRTFKDGDDERCTVTLTGEFTPNYKIEWYIDDRKMTETGTLAVVAPDSQIKTDAVYAPYYKTLGWSGGDYVRRPIGRAAVSGTAFELFTAEDTQLVDILRFWTTEGLLFVKLAGGADAAPVQPGGSTTEPVTPDPVTPDPAYGNYAVAADAYSFAFFSAASAEKAVPVTGDSADTLIPLNVSTAGAVNFGGMDGFAAAIPFYKANYDAKAGTLTGLKEIPITYVYDKANECYEALAMADLFAAAEKVAGNAVVMLGAPALGTDEVNADVFYAAFLLKPDGKAPEAPEPAQPEITFTDVDSRAAWAKNAIYASAEAGLVLGAGGKFDPTAELSWAQAITFAVRLAQYQAGEHVYGKEDQGSPWYQVYVDYALAHGFIDKAPAKPNDVIDRSDALNIFAAVLDESAPAVNDVPDGYFTDLTPDHPVYEAAYKLARAGITNGIGGGKFGPDAELTREQVSALVARIAGLVDPAKIN